MNSASFISDHSRSESEWWVVGSDSCLVVENSAEWRSEPETEGGAKEGERAHPRAICIDVNTKHLRKKGFVKS